MLASPIIEGTLPAFYYSDEKGCAELAIPFSMSRAVSESEVHGFKLKIKDIQNYEYLLTLNESEIQFNNGIVKFRIDKPTLDSKFLIGQFYKAQLAYTKLDSQGREVVGYYSTVGIIKYTTKPIVEILDLKRTTNNAHIYTYTGSYSQKGQDVSEKEYAYKFIVTDELGSVVEDTGFIIHNNSNDTNNYESSDIFKFSRDLQENEKYSITYIVKTNNNLEISSPSYRIMNKKAIVSTLTAQLKAKLNFENGYVQLWLEGDRDENNYEKLVTGSFVLARASEENNYTDWEDLFEFSLASQRPSLKSWKDFTIQQGINYKYSIQQRNKKGLQSARILSNIVYADFEYCFLYDGERQLKIKFNPKMSSFKKDILESKVDTLGSKYPFIFRNGQVEYKEFPIQGLISYLSDEENLFLTQTADLFHTRERQSKVNYKEIFNPLRDIASVTDPAKLKERREEYTYKNNYMYYYVYDSKTKTYQRWTSYAKNLPPRKAPNGELSKYFKIDFQDWDSVYRYYTEIVYSPSGVRVESPPTPPYSIFDASRENVNILDYDSRKWASTNLDSHNIFTEREFKIEVLNWLTNGKPKLFKSPTEGNYIVRLMNVALQPQDQLGRMLHNFTSTAYEIADMTYKSLVEYGIIGDRYDTKQYVRIVTIPLSTRDQNYVNLSPIEYVYDENAKMYFATGHLLKKSVEVQNAVLTDIEPGSKIYINDEPIIIGSTGTYEIPFEVSQVSLPEGMKSHGLLTIQYMSAINDSFNTIERVETEEILGKQIIGQCKNVLDTINNVTSQAVTFYDIRLNKRPIIDLYATTYQHFNEVIDPNEVTEKNVTNYYVQKPIYKSIVLTQEIYQPGVYYYKSGNDYYISWVDFNPNETYFVISDYYFDQATYYSSVAKYFKKEAGFEVFEKNGDLESVLSYQLLSKGEMPILIKNTLNANPLALYRFSLDYDPIVSTYLYEEQFFDTTDKKDSLNQMDRSLSNRLTTNPNLHNIRDFKWFVQNNMLFYFDKSEREFRKVEVFTPKTGERYFIQKPICYIYDPQNPDIFYVDKETYERFETLYSVSFKQQAPNIFRKYNKVTYVAFLNEQPLSLEDRDIMHTGPMDMIDSLSVPAGLYCELFYQNQFIYHDISQNASLVTQREMLDEMENQLSRDYMEKVCTTPEGEQTYVQTLVNIYNSYSTLKRNYIAELEIYLKQLEEEV